VYVARADAAPLEPGAHYIADLLGCRVADPEGGELGVLAHVFRTGSNDVYEVRRGDGTFVYLPVIDQVVLNVDIENNTITVDASVILETEDVKD